MTIHPLRAFWLRPHLLAAMGLAIGLDADAARSARLALAGLALLCAWGFVPAVFAVHDAHPYYGEGETGQSRGGLDVNGDPHPDVWDVLYFSVTVRETSDTDITSKPIHRLVTVRTVYAYLFTISVLALGIDMAAGLAQH